MSCRRAPACRRGEGRRPRPRRYPGRRNRTPRQALAAGERGNAGCNVLPPIVDRVAAAVGLGEIALLGVAGAADDGGARMSEPLAEQQAVPPAAAWTSTVSAGCTAAALVDQVFRGLALEHGGGGLLEADGVGQPDQRIGRDGSKPRIGAGRGARVGDAVALLERRHRTADGLDHARALEADDPGQPRRGKVPRR